MSNTKSLPDNMRDLAKHKHPRASELVEKAEQLEKAFGIASMVLKAKMHGTLTPGCGLFRSRGSNKMSRLININLFAGAGGSCHGHYMATGEYIDIAVNHDPIAVEVHAFNNPHTEHYVQDIYQVSPYAVAKGRPVGRIWASPDCTYHSVARGSAPIRNVKRRDLPFVVSGVWVPALKPLVLQLENVKEILHWGPLDSNGQPVEAAKGDYWRSFINQLRRQGYKVEWQILKACDYGVATTRERLYLTARRDGLPIAWPEPTHAAPDSPEVLSGQKLPWVPAADFIDWSLPCPSIFETSAEIKAKYGLNVRRPLKEASLRRIARGIQRFVLDNPKPFVVHYFGDKGQDVFRGASAYDPLSTCTAGGNRHGLVMPKIAPITYNIAHSTSATRHIASVEAPLGTVLTKSEHALAVASLAPFVFGSGGPAYAGTPASLERPIGTALTQNHKALAVANLVKYYGTGQGSSLAAPLDTCTTKPRFGMTVSYLSKLYGTTVGQGSDEPLHTVTAGGTHFAAVYAFLQQYNGKSFGQAADSPLHTVTCKDGFSLVLCYVGGVPYAIYDIGMRMLQPYEQAGCMGFPTDYRLDWTPTTGPVTKEDQNRLIGNAVCPGMAEVLIAANPIKDTSAAFELPKRWQPTFWPSREEMGASV